MTKKYRTEDWVKIVGKGRIKQLREAAISSKLKRPLWISTYLNDSQIAEVYYRIFEKNESLESVAKKVKLVWGVQPSWTIQQFVRGLETWKNRLATKVTDVKEVVKEHKDKVALKKVRDKLEDLNREVNALGMLGYAIEVQAERIQMFREFENKRNMPVSATDQALKTFRELCDTYGNMAVRLGVLEGAPTEINVNLQAKGQVIFDKVIGDDGSRLITCGNKLLQRLEEHCVLMEQDDKGEFVEVKERRKTTEVDMSDERHTGIIRE